MTSQEFDIRPTGPNDLEHVAALHANAFGPGRFVRTAYRVREDAPPTSPHCQCAWRGATLIGSVTLTAITIGAESGHWLLGPLAVRAGDMNRGLGQRLCAAALKSIAANGAPLATVILIGDLAYYERLGFEATIPGQIILPGPVDPARLLAWRNPDASEPMPAGTVRPG